MQVSVRENFLKRQQEKISNSGRIEERIKKKSVQIFRNLGFPTQASHMIILLQNRGQRLIIQRIFVCLRDGNQYKYVCIKMVVGGTQNLVLHQHHPSCNQSINDSIHNMLLYIWRVDRTRQNSIFKSNILTDIHKASH